MWEKRENVGGFWNPQKLSGLYSPQKTEKSSINNCEKKREKTEQIAEDAMEIHHSDKQQTSFQTP